VVQLVVLDAQFAKLFEHRCRQKVYMIDRLRALGNRTFERVSETLQILVASYRGNRLDSVESMRTFASRLSSSYVKMQTWSYFCEINNKRTPTYHWSLLQVGRRGRGAPTTSGWQDIAFCSTFPQTWTAATVNIHPSIVVRNNIDVSWTRLSDLRVIFSYRVWTLEQCDTANCRQ